MNNYQIYPDPIGRGKYSTVYKARKKRTIEYFAIKSVDKSQKSKVLHEVRMLHALDHSNVLRFYAWYETSAHLWLVLEYCVGGDLFSLLRQDMQLPEESVHDFAYDLATALQYLHSKGIIYSDLKPSNVLLDENGHIKLSHFGLAKKLADLSKNSSSMLPQAKRGTPYYMAPELFQDGGFHSYASDLWALGCVLYECYAGRPPFVAREFTQLAKSIISDPTPPLPGNPSRQLVNLINSLLVKDPVERIQWPELCAHAFWQKELVSLPLPQHPAFTNLVDLSNKRCLTEQNGERHPQSKNAPVQRERDMKGNSRQGENCNSATRGYHTPEKGVSSGRKMQSKTSTRVAEDRAREPSSATKAVNLLRLSRIAKSNLQRENEKENYRRPLASGAENDSEIKIENTDMELDFSENPEDEPQDESDATENPPWTPEAKTPTRVINEPGTDSQPPTTGVTDDSDTHEQESLSNEPDSTPRSAGNPNNQKSDTVSTQETESGSPNGSSDISDVFWHPSDLSVRPVMPSRKADKMSESMPSLPFAALPASEFLKMSKDQIDAYSAKIVSVLNSNSAISEKQNLIRYLETLSGDRDAANILTNGPIILVLVKMLRQSKAYALRVQLAALIGLLIRHSIYIENDLASSGILGALADGLRDRQERVRRFSMAALGELLFYISSQNELERDDNGPDSLSKESRPSSGWQVPNALVSLVSSVLRKGEDDMTQLYALRTIENIFSQGAQWVIRFTSQDLISNLCYIFRAAGKQESMRLTAGSCLVRLVRFNPTCISSVIEKLSVKEIATALVKGNAREQQISLNLLIMAMLASQSMNIGRNLVPFVEEKNLVPSVVSLIEQGSEVLRGKTLVLVALLCKNGRRWLPHFFCNGRLLSIVDRLAKERNNYLQQSFDAFVHIVALTVPGLLENITADIQLMMGGRRHALNNRAAPKTSIHLFPVVLHLLGSSSFRNRVANPDFVQHLTNIIKLVESPFQGRDDFQITLLRVLESTTEETSVILENAQTFICDILPSLSILYKGNKDGDARFLCLKILFEVMVIFLNEPSEDTKRAEQLKSISNKHFLPIYPMLIEDEDPIPMYAQKLLVMMIEFNYINIADILHLKTIQRCFEFLLGDLSTANVSNVKLCLALASAPELDTKVLSQLKVVRRIGNLLEFITTKDMEDFMEPTLALCRAFLLRSFSYKKHPPYCSKEPNLLLESHSDPPGAVDQPQCVRDISDFGSNMGVLLELSRAHEPTVSDIASECVVLLLKVAPREATTGFLTNLSKVTALLEDWHRDSHSPNLLILRMLHALGHSCRQYLAYAMILSISSTEISKIKAVLAVMRGCDTPAVTSAASVVAMELDRLPRCL